MVHKSKKVTVEIGKGLTKQERQELKDILEQEFYYPASPFMKGWHDKKRVLELKATAKELEKIQREIADA